MGNCLPGGRKPFLFILYFTAFSPKLQAFCEKFLIFVISARKNLSDHVFCCRFTRIGKRLPADGAKTEECGQLTDPTRLAEHPPSPLHPNGANGGGSALDPTCPNVEAAAQAGSDPDRRQKADVLPDPLLLNGKAEANEQNGRFAGIDDAE